MRILFDLGHPGHVHLFKNTMKELRMKGHDVFAVIRERENTVKPLLKNIDISYKELNPNAKGIIPKAITMFKNDYSLLGISKKIHPDIFISITSPYSAQVSKIVGMPHITFADTEDAKLILWLTIPFTDVVITEKSYMGKLPEKKHVSLPTWRPLAYLHHKYFTPNKEVLDIMGVSKNDKYFIMRFSAWDASHDWKIKRDFSWEERYRVIKMLEKEGYVFITSELPLPKKFQKYKLKIPPYLFHDALAFSSGYIGEGHITARETVSLRKPAILVSPRGKEEGYVLDMKNRGFLMLFERYSDISPDSLNFIVSADESFSKKVEAQIRDMVDLTSFLSWFIENYPNSMKNYRKNKNVLNKRFMFGK